MVLFRSSTRKTQFGFQTHCSTGGNEVWGARVGRCFQPQHLKACFFLPLRNCVTWGTYYSSRSPGSESRTGVHKIYFAAESGGFNVWRLVVPFFHPLYLTTIAASLGMLTSDRRLLKCDKPACPGNLAKTPLPNRRTSNHFSAPAEFKALSTFHFQNNCKQ